MPLQHMHSLPRSCSLGAPLAPFCNLGAPLCRPTTQVDLQPSSALTLPGVWQGVTAWDGWGPAVDTSAARDSAEAAVERVRWWAEQCDHLQGYCCAGAAERLPCLLLPACRQRLFAPTAALA